MALHRVRHRHRVRTAAHLDARHRARVEDRIRWAKDTQPEPRPQPLVRDQLRLANVREHSAGVSQAVRCRARAKSTLP